MELFHLLPILFGIILTVYWGSRKSKKNRDSNTDESSALTLAKSNITGKTDISKKTGGKFEKYGYHIEFAHPGFGRDFLRDVAGDVTMSYSNIGHFIVIPVYLHGHTPTLEAVSAGLLSNFDISLQDPALQLTRKISRYEDCPGYEFNYKRPLKNQATYHFQIQIYLRENFAYLFCAISSHPKEILEFHAPFNTIQFNTPAEFSEFSLNDTERNRHRDVFNHIGLYYLRNGDQSAALNFLQLAEQENHDNPVVTTNLAFLLEHQGKNTEALERLRNRENANPGNSQLQARLANLESLQGDPDQARKLYTHLFEDPGVYRDAEDFSDYIRFLSDQNEEESALKRAEDFYKETGALETILLLAQLYTRRKEYDKALSTLDRRSEECFLNSDLAFSRIIVLQTAERDRDCLEWIDELIKRGQFISADLYYKKAESEAALKRFQDAKNSLERALKDQPEDIKIKNALLHVSGMLGEGDISQIKEEIPEVPLPVDVKSREIIGDETSRDDVYYPLVSHAYHYEKGKELRVTGRLVMEFLTKASIQIQQTYKVSFNPLKEKLFVNRAVLILPDGRETVLDRSSMFVLDDTESNSEADYEKVLNIPIQGAAVGARLELTITRRHLKTANRFPWKVHHLVRFGGVGHSIVSIQGSEQELQEIHSYASPEVPLTSREGLRIWEQLDLPAFIPEPRQLHIYETTPTVFLSGESRNWADMGAEYLKEISEHLTPSPSIKDIAERAVQGIESTEEKIRALYHLVQNEIAYLPIEFGARGFIPEKDEVTLANKYGDSKDMSVLFCNLAQSLGINALPALVGFFKLPPQLRDMDMFQHMLVYVPELSQFLDPTLKHHALLSLPPGLGKKQILVLETGSVRILETPAYSMDESNISIRRKARVMEEKTAGVHDLIVHEKSEITGYYAGFIREELTQVPGNLQEQMLREQIKQDDYEILELDIKNVDEASKPLILNLKYRVVGGLERKTDEMHLNLPALMERFYIRFDSLPNRRFPFQVEYGLNIKSRMLLDLGGPGTPVSEDKTQNDSSVQWQFKVDSRKENHSVLSVAFSLKLNPGRFEPQEDLRLTEELNRATVNWKSKLRLQTVALAK